MNPPRIPTSVGMETVDETVARAKAQLGDAYVAPKAPIQPTVSANELTNPPAPVTPPVPTAPTIPARVGQFVSNVARDNQGFITAQTEEAKKRQETFDQFAALGEQGSLSDMMMEQRKELGIDTNLSELKDIQLQLTDMDTASALTKTRIEGAAGQTLGQAQREVTQEDRENAVRTSGLAARAAVLQGNINTATQLAKDTVDLAFKDRQLTSENLISQINYYQGLVDEQTSQLMEEDKRQYEADLERVNELKTSISEAMVNGATQAEIAELSKAVQPLPNETQQEYQTRLQQADAQKLALAQSITARGATQMRNLQMEQANASIRSSNASAALNEAELIAFNKAQEDAANGILSPEQMGAANDINKDFEGQQIVKDYNAGLQKYIVLEDTLSNGIDGIQDLQLVYDFMKAVDPTSVVRETEFENAAKTGNIFQGTMARFNKNFGSGGFLPEDVKQDFIRSARTSFEAKNNQYFNVKSEYAKRMNNTVGVNNGADYLTAYEAVAPLDEVDFGIADTLSGASPEDIADIMLMTEGYVGANIYGK